MTTDESSILEKIVVRAWEDNEFKEELLKNPKAVIEQESGTKIREGLEIQVFEETLTTRYLVLPRRGASLPENEEIEQTGTNDPVSELITKAVEDSSFREKLISNPNAVVEEELGIQLPKEVEIRVLEQQANLRYFALPVSPEWEEEEESVAEIGKIKVKLPKVKAPTKLTSLSGIGVCVCG
jgi:hypothetical protein